MEHYITDKALKGYWWDIPVLAVSGLVTAASLSVLFDYITHPGPDLGLSLFAGVFVTAIVSAPIWLYVRRRRLQADAVKIAKTLAASGQSSMTCGALQRRTGIRGIQKRVEQLIGKGMLRNNIALDAARDMFRFDRPEDAPAPIQDTGNADYNEILRQIRELNDKIDNRAVSQKIDRIEQLTGDVFKLLNDRPDRAKDTRRFISYYLPVTMKLLESYSLLEKQRYQGR